MISIPYIFPLDRLCLITIGSKLVRKYLRCILRFENYILSYYKSYFNGSSAMI